MMFDQSVRDATRSQDGENLIFFSYYWLYFASGLELSLSTNRVFIRAISSEFSNDSRPKATNLLTAANVSYEQCPGR